MLTVSTRPKRTVHDRPSSPGDGQASASSPSPRLHDRRAAVARALVETIQGAVVDPSAIAIVLDESAATTDPSVLTPRAPIAGMQPGDAQPMARVVIRGPDALGRLLPPTPDGFADGFLRGDLEIEGDVAAALRTGPALDLRRLRVADARRMLRWGWELWRATPRAASLERVSQVSGRRHSRARDMAAIRFHYDVGDAFFGVWLDRRLTYTSGYFPEGTTAGTAADRLDEAQEAKLELVCRKLQLASGLRLLDIGSGWGSLVSYAGEHHGCEAVGVTLSDGQVAAANARAAAAGLGERVRSEVRDYRDLAPLGTFDRVASIGMFEHVGRGNLATYFRSAFDALRPGGLFLNHGVASSRARGSRLLPDRRPAASRFLQRYVFPDGELVPVEEAIAQARAVGFEVIDVQSLRPHYALTLAAWVARLERGWPAAIEVAGAEVARTWRLYMAASRLGFEEGTLDVCQMLLAKPDGGRPARLPLRPWWWTSSRRRSTALPIAGD